MKLANKWYKSWSFWSAILFSMAAVVEQMLPSLVTLPQGWQMGALLFVAIVRVLPQKAMKDAA